MNTPLKPKGRTLGEFEPLQPAEKKLLAACRDGLETVIAAKRPEDATDENTVRAAFLRFLALGGDGLAPVHEKGVQLQGAWIKDTLDMEGADIPHGLKMVGCNFEATLVFRNAKIAGSFNLSGSQLPGFKGDGISCAGGLFLRQGFKSTEAVRLLGAQIGVNLECSGATFDGGEGDALTADGAVIKGGVFLNKKFTAKGEVRLLGAQIGGSLSCDGATFDGGEGDALTADGAVIKGGVFLNEKFTAKGEVRLLGAQIGGDLACDGATFDGGAGDALTADRAVIKGSVFLNEKFTAKGDVSLLGAQIGGNLECDGATFDGGAGNALTADGMRVAGSFMFRKLKQKVNGVSLSGVQVGQLIDDTDRWGERIRLDGFVYDAISGGAPTDAATRLAWLDKQDNDDAGRNGGGDKFKPQPWRQLAKVLREMGHVEDARQVSIAFEKRLYKANLIGQTPNEWGWLRTWSYRQISRAVHWMFGVLTGYGYRPLRLIFWMIVVGLLCAALYWVAALKGVFSPSDPLVFQHPNYQVCSPSYIAPVQPASAVAPAIQGAGNWYLCEKLPEEYAGFSPLAYSFDVILPLVDLQQENSWSPLIPTPKSIWYAELFSIFDWKHFTRLVLWFEILFGWLSSLLLVAVVSGLTKRREE